MRDRVDAGLRYPPTERQGSRARSHNVGSTLTPSALRLGGSQEKQFRNRGGSSAYEKGACNFLSIMNADGKDAIEWAPGSEAPET
ncbi:hypothetical protein [Bradyrhizobium sp. USDA 4350]